MNFQTLRDSPKVDHSFPWDAWVHKTTVIEMGFYTVTLSNATEQILNMVIERGGGKFADLFMDRLLGRRPKK